METGGAAMGQDWSALPLDVLLISMSSMEVPDVVRSGAVCTTWRSAYAAFRALGLATPRQPPCLLYYARDSPGPGTTATLYSPSTNASFRVPMEGHSGGFLGSAHGWLFTTDEAANPYLLNPLTGARAALPPITTLERVRSSSCACADDDDGGGGVVYNVDFRWRLSESEPEMKQVTARRARDWIYHRVAVSASPLAAARGGAACVVLLIHMPYEELSFARPGDERWASLSNLCPYDRGLYSSAVYNDKDGLFYVLRSIGSVHALDLMTSGPSPPAEARVFAYTLMNYSTHYTSKCTRYLVPMPSASGCGARLLLVTRRWCRSPGRREILAGDEVRVVYAEPKHVITTGIQLDTIDGFRMERLAGPGDHALFLGSNDSALYLPTKSLPSALSKQDSAYLTDDVSSDTFHSPMSRQDVGVWDFGSKTMKKLGDMWPLVHPWLDSPAPIWITPSLC